MILTSGEFFGIDKRVAHTLGVCETFVLTRIDGWLSIYQDHRSKYEKDHFKEGRWWTYDTIDALTEDIMIYGKRAIQNALKNLKDQKIIIISHFGGNFDHTNWYTIDYDILLEVVRQKHPEITELMGKCKIVNSDDAHSATSDDAHSATSSNILNNIYKNKTNISLIYIKDPAEQEKVCQMFDKVIKNDLIANYPIHTNLEVVEIMIRNRVGDCHSFDEAEQLLGAIWHGVNIYKSEYAAKHKDEDENVDYTYLPNLRKVYTTELANETNYYFREGLKKHRQFMYNKYRKEYGGDANAG